MKALVTGANGFIGSHVCRVLLKHKINVVAFMKQSSNQKTLENMKIEYRYGDIRNYEDVNKAMQECDVVFHIAALHLSWMQNYRVMYDINVNGSENIFKAALSNNIRRVIYTSTQNVIGMQNDGYVNENFRFSRYRFASHYTVSKFQAENLAYQYINKGLDIVIVNPSGPFGEGDYKIGPTSKIIVNFLKRNYPFYFKAWFNAIDVEDVAEGHYLALINGEKGERYILSNKNLSLDDFFDMLSVLTNIPKPKFIIPRWLAFLLAFTSELISKIFTHKAPLITIDRVIQRGKPRFLDNSKAISKLGLTLTPIEETLQKAIKFYKELT
jgi:dihydroflavonol-4-reductase